MKDGDLPSIFRPTALLVSATSLNLGHPGAIRGGFFLEIMGQFYSAASAKDVPKA